MNEDKRLEIKSLIENNYSSWGESFNSMTIMEQYVFNNNEHYNVSDIQNIYEEVKNEQPNPETVFVDDGLM